MEKPQKEFSLPKELEDMETEDFHDFLKKNHEVTIEDVSSREKYEIWKKHKREEAVKQKLGTFIEEIEEEEEMEKDFNVSESAESVVQAGRILSGNKLVENGEQNENDNEMTLGKKIESVKMVRRLAIMVAQMEEEGESTEKIKAYNKALKILLNLSFIENNIIETLKRDGLKDKRLLENLELEKENIIKEAGSELFSREETKKRFHAIINILKNQLDKMYKLREKGKTTYYNTSGRKIVIENEITLFENKLEKSVQLLGKFNEVEKKIKNLEKKYY